MTYWCTLIWVNSGIWWWTGRPGMLRFMGSQRVRHNWVTELNWTTYHGKESEKEYTYIHTYIYIYIHIYIYNWITLLYIWNWYTVNQLYFKNNNNNNKECIGNSKYNQHGYKTIIYLVWYETKTWNIFSLGVGICSATEYELTKFQMF